MSAIQIEPSHTNGKVHVTDEVASVIRVAEIFKEYRRGDTVVHALRSVSLAVVRGEFVAVMGPSGSGNPPS